MILVTNSIIHASNLERLILSKNSFLDDNYHDNNDEAKHHCFQLSSATREQQQHSQIQLQQGDGTEVDETEQEQQSQEKEHELTDSQEQEEVVSGEKSDGGNKQQQNVNTNDRTQQQQQQQQRNNISNQYFVHQTWVRKIFQLEKVVVMIILLVLSTTTTTIVSVTAASVDTTTLAYEYNICNGLSNQLLYHSASIAIAIANEKRVILVPDHYIINGVQMSNDNVYPTKNNSVPFRIVFDQSNFISSIQSISSSYLQTKYNTNTNTATAALSQQPEQNDGKQQYYQHKNHIKPIQIVMVSFDDDEESRNIPCAGMNAVLNANPHILLNVLQKAFQPSIAFQTIINQIKSHSHTSTKDNSKSSSNNNSNGICVHHRDGIDWHEHCSRWGSIQDGIYRGNCLSVPNETFIQSIQYRGIAPAISNNDNENDTRQLHQHQQRNRRLAESSESSIVKEEKIIDTTNNSVKQRHQQAATSRTLLESTSTDVPSISNNWIYYCGDHDPPSELQTVTFPKYVGDHSNNKNNYDEIIKTGIFIQQPVVAVGNKKMQMNVYQRQDDVFDTILAKLQSTILLQQNTTSKLNSNNNNPNESSIDDRTESDEQILYRILNEAAHDKKHRDIFALIDFFVCSTIPYFIGNSVSTFSAIQIAIRNNTKSYWYNSQSIPLADPWQTYPIPIVYTYTESSQLSGKFLLQASIASVRKHMPYNPINILYHGTTDIQFINWLQNTMSVQVHYHKNIIWKDSIELMRQHGNVTKSNLFLQAGNYFGTWQRIDIPLFIESEYCLLLDSDTIVRKPFTMTDFGLHITRSIALSAEFDQYTQQPINAGIMLMNVPYLRKTYNKFISYILEHVSNATFNHPSPSDQGAYLSFYKDTVQFLDTKFNFKPYWLTSDIDYRTCLILHFHGAKPSDYIKYAIMMMESHNTDVIAEQKKSYSSKVQQFALHHLRSSSNNNTSNQTEKVLTTKCDEAIQFLCNLIPNVYFICPSLQEFARAVNIVDYCTAAMKNNTQHITMCISFLETIIDDRTNSTSRIVFGRSDLTNTIGCQYFDAIVLGHGGSNVQQAQYRRKALDQKMIRMRPEHTVKQDMINFDNKVIFNKHHSIAYNNMFKGIKDYKTRRIVRIVMSYIIYGVALVCICKLYSLVKRCLPTRIVTAIQYVQFKVTTAIGGSISTIKHVFVSRNNKQNQYHHHPYSSSSQQHQYHTNNNHTNNYPSNHDFTNLINSSKNNSFSNNNISCSSSNNSSSSDDNNNNNNNNDSNDFYISNNINDNNSPLMNKRTHNSSNNTKNSKGTTTATISSKNGNLIRRNNHNGSSK